MERKHLRRPFEIKAVADDGVFEGYGSVFGVEDWYRDVVAKGAFSRSLADWKLKGALPVLCWQHDATNVIGVYEEMFEDDHGLYLRGRLLKDDIPQARNAYALLKNKAISGLSIGYNIKVDEYDRNTEIRTLKEVDLWEVSLVTFPANEMARVESVKNMKTVTDLERFLRDAGGISRAEARQVVHDIKASMRQACTMEELSQLIQKNIETLRG